MPSLEGEPCDSNSLTTKGTGGAVPENKLRVEPRSNSRKKTLRTEWLLQYISNMISLVYGFDPQSYKIFGKFVTLHA